MSARELAVTVVGADRPGIVSGVTKVLYELGCNLADATSTILRGQFSMMLVVGCAASRDELEQGLAAVARDLDLSVTVVDLHPGAAREPAPTHVVSVYGADRPGIVYRIADALAGAGANVTDFVSRLMDSSGEPVYALMLEVEADEDAVAAVERAARDGGLDVTVRPIEADVL